MPDTYTPVLALTKPEIGASRDSWGSKTNTNWDTLDQFVSMAAPIGMMADFAGTQAPAGWLIADGRTVSRTTYSQLFGVLGTAWGAGDGSTTFALPNPNGRASVGPGTVTDVNGNSVSFTFAQLTGNIYNQIAQAHLPNYAIYTDVQGSHAHGGATAPGGNHNHATDVQGNHSHGGVTALGANHTHTGVTDNQGDHSHSLYEVFGGSGSGGGGGFTVSGASYFGGYTSTNGAHTHNVSTNPSGNLQLGINADGNHAHNITYSGNLQLGINADGNHQHTIYLGGSSAWFPVLSPVIVVTKIIYAGNQAVARVTVDTAPSALRSTEDEPDELAVIREELAALRALFAPAGRHPRLLQAPIRGPH